MLTDLCSHDHSAFSFQFSSFIIISVSLLLFIYVSILLAIFYIFTSFDCFFYFLRLAPGTLDNPTICFKDLLSFLMTKKEINMSVVWKKSLQLILNCEEQLKHPWTYLKAYPADSAQKNRPKDRINTQMLIKMCQSKNEAKSRGARNWALGHQAVGAEEQIQGKTIVKSKNFTIFMRVRGQVRELPPLPPFFWCPWLNHHCILNSRQKEFMFSLGFFQLIHCLQTFSAS